jgi:CheY-like chemotaxis protein
MLNLRRVLVADDYDDARDLYAAYLRSLGYEVVVAADGLQALNSAMSLPIDVVILDIAMPGLDGLEVLRRLRAAGNRVPVITLTASTFPTVTDLATAAGCDLAMEKPCTPEELERAISKLLDARTALTQA